MANTNPDSGIRHMTNQSRLSLPTITIVTLTVLVLIILILSNQAQAYDFPKPQPPELVGSNVSDSIANCHYGVTIDRTANQLEWVATFGAGWFLDFQIESPIPSNDAEFVGIVYVRQDKDSEGNYLPSVTIVPELTQPSLGAVIERNPGRIWLIGNEVDRGPNPGQIDGGVGDTFPDMYAKAYHDTYYFIKNIDPTALVANSALVEVTPGRLQYLDKVLKSYRARYGHEMPVDVWNMHLYILPELTYNGKPNNVANIALGTDPSLGILAGDSTTTVCPREDVYCIMEHDDMDAFAGQVVAMREWMRENGQQQKPLIISEYSVLWPYIYNGVACGFVDEAGNCFDPPRIGQYVANSFDYLKNTMDPDLGYGADKNRLVQQWLWYGVYYKYLGHTSNLITDDVPAQLTPAGTVFQNTTHSEAPTINLVPGQMNTIFTFVNNPADTTNARLVIPVHNNGNSGLQTGFQVTFYQDAGLNQVIGTAVVPPPGPDELGLTGCAIRHVDASVTWPNLTLGSHTFWAKIDPGNSITEIDENDNVVSGEVLVMQARMFIPAANKN